MSGFALYLLVFLVAAEYRHEEPLAADIYQACILFGAACWALTIAATGFLGFIWWMARRERSRRND